MDQLTVDIQKRLLEILQWFHEYCEEHQLNYYAIGGTLLGAVRHQGFIPWDDDIDVGMPRKDYERFLELTEGKTVSDHYVVESFRSAKEDYIYPYAKVYDTTTTLVETARIPVKRGLYLDVFPIDNAGETLDEAMKKWNLTKRKYDLVLMKVCAINKERKLYKNLAILLARVVPKCVLNRKTLLRELDEVCKQPVEKECRYVANFVGNWGACEIVERSYFGVPQKYKFEDIQIYGVEKPDEYLTNIYGDYMTLPPEEKRKSHHAFVFCDLNKPYMNG